MTGGPRSFGPACFLLLGLFIAARMAAPFFPSEAWSESGFHCASYYVFLALGRAHGCVAENAFGEGARVANRLDFVSPRREKFTVDARGYRNPPLSGLQPRVILLGSSFSLGLSLSDDETLPAQLNQRLGPVVYNESKVLNRVLSPGELVETARAIGVRNGWVLIELLNRGVYDYQAVAPWQGFAARALERVPAFQSFERRVKDPFALSRITSVINMRIANDSLLPNPDRWRFPEEELNDGRHMLFYFDDKAFFLNPGPARTTVDSIARLSSDVKSAGLRVAVVLVPNGYTVYWSLMRGVTGEDRGGEYLADLEERLRGIGVPVLNCLPLLRRAAAKEFSHGRLVYWPDDAHWNPQGVEAAADGIAPWLAGLLSEH